MAASKKIKKLAVSIIIPTLNEEHYVGNLLSSLASQNMRDFEVIVVDGNSKDKTVEVCAEYQKILPDLTIIKSKKKGVSFQRNLGARQAKADILLFLDADIIMPFDFLDKSLLEFNNNNGGIATCVSWPMGEKTFDYFAFLFTNLTIKTFKKIAPVAYGWTIFAKKKLHEDINGFDENIIYFEDSDYCRRAFKKKARFIVIQTTSPYVSVRRFNHEGRAKLVKKLARFYTDYIFNGPEAAHKEIVWETGVFGNNIEKSRENEFPTGFRKIISIMKTKNGRKN